MNTDKAFTGKLEPEDVNYIPLSNKANEACANCRWFIAGNDPHWACFIVDASDADDEPILATGICDRWEANPQPTENPTEVLAEAIVEAISESTDVISEAVYSSMPMAMPMDMGKSKKTIRQRIQELFKPKSIDDAFTVFKGSDGAWHWHAIYTNNFEDLEGEILTEKGHDAYINRLDMGLVPMPVLQAWHTPGSEHGEADSIWRNGHFIHAIGHFYDTPVAEKALKFYQKNVGKIKMSHGFIVPDWAFDGKHYDDYNTIEITTLPPYAAANPYTSFEELKEMALTEEKRRYLEQVVGKDKLAEIEAKDTDRSKALEDMKIAYKDFAQTTPVTPEPVTLEKEKVLGTLFTDVVNMQDEMLQVMTLQKKAIDSKDALITALKTEKDTEVSELKSAIADLQKIVNAPPSRASQSQATIINPEQTTLKDVLPGDDLAEKFFGVPMKKVTN